jgi:hypothetical protein
MGKKSAAAPAPAPAAPATEIVELPYGEVEVTPEDKQVAAEIRRHAASTAAPDVSSFLTPQELELKKATDEAIARGEDPLGDDEPIVRTQEEADEANAAAAAQAQEEADDDDDDGDAADAGTGAAAEAGDDDDGALDAAALAALAGDDTPAAESASAPAGDAAAAPAPAAELDDDALPPELLIPEPTLVKVEDAKKLADAREAAEAKLDEIESKWTKQEISDEERAEQLKAARREHSAALRAEAKNDAALEANQANQLAMSQRVIDGVVKVAKAEGTIDYTKDEKAIGQFNRALSVVASDPDNSTRSYAQLCMSAHRMVCAQRGIVAKVAARTSAAPAPAPAAVAAPAAGKPAARVAPPAPPTLRGLPTAASPGAGDSLADQLSRLKGQDFETAWARLSPAQREQYLND